MNKTIGLLLAVVVLVGIGLVAWFYTGTSEVRPGKEPTKELQQNAQETLKGFDGSSSQAEVPK